MSLVTSIAVQPQITAALEQASVRTGVDFDYLLRTAKRESGLETQAKAKTSSAAGLFQFIEETWLTTVKKYGAEFGLNGYAQAIERDAQGRHKVSDPALKAEILALRHDPQAASLMAGVLTKESAEALETDLGRPPKEGELYIAHFLGAGGAGRLIAAAESAPSRFAAALFPDAAGANRAIFYETSGKPRTVAQVYDVLTTPPGSQGGDRDTGAVASGDHLPGPLVPGPLMPGSLAGGGAGGAEFFPPAPQTFATYGTAYGRHALLLSAPVVELLASFDPLKDLRGGTQTETDH